MIPGSILDDDQMFSGFTHHHFEELLIGRGIEPAFNALVEQPTGYGIDRTKDLVGFSDATGKDFGLVSFLGPRVRKRSPLGKAGFIHKKQQGIAPGDLFKDVRPGLFQPPFAGLLIQMRRGELGLLIRVADVVQQRTDIEAAVEDTEGFEDGLLDQKRIPASCRETIGNRPGVKNISQVCLVRLLELGPSTRTFPIAKTVKPFDQEGSNPRIDSLLRYRQILGNTGYLPAMTQG